MEQEKNLSPQENGLALVCHLSMFFAAFIVPLVIYFLQKEKSKYVAFNALEAAYFHLLYMIVLLLTIFIMFGIGLGEQGTRSGDGSQSAIAFLIAFFIVFFAVILFFIINAIIAAVKSYQGEIKKYPVVGNMAYNQVYNR
jgi:uncharacterized Tic20 family protein